MYSDPQTIGQDVIQSRLLSEQDRCTLELWARSPTVPRRIALRSRIILTLGQGATGRATALALGISRTTVDLWRRRFAQGGCRALLRDKPGRGRKSAVVGRSEGAANAADAVADQANPGPD